MSDQNESNEQTVSSEQLVSSEQPVGQESKPIEKVQKQKNPKRVEAVTKGAAARWAKRSANLEKPEKQKKWETRYWKIKYWETRSTHL